MIRLKKSIRGTAFCCAFFVGAFLLNGCRWLAQTKSYPMNPTRIELEWIYCVNASEDMSRLSSGQDELVLLLMNKTRSKIIAFDTMIMASGDTSFLQFPPLSISDSLVLIGLEIETNFSDWFNEHSPYFNDVLPSHYFSNNDILWQYPLASIKTKDITLEGYHLADRFTYIVSSKWRSPIP